MAFLNKANIKQLANKFTQEEKDRMDQEYRDSMPIESGPLAGFAKSDEKFFKWLATSESIAKNLVIPGTMLSAPQFLLMMAAGFVMDGIKLNDMKAVKLIGTDEYKNEYPNGKFDPDKWFKGGKKCFDTFREFVIDVDNFIEWAEVYSFVRKHKDIITPEWVRDFDWSYVYEL